jgi:hydroxymethylbilane synthase
MTIPPQTTLRLGTRGSLLARTQSRLVAKILEQRHAGLRVEEVVLVTSGDIITDRPLHEVGGKGLFTKELELALLRGEIDFAVHSYKDVPVTEPLIDQAELVIASVLPREDPRDVLVSLRARRIGDLPQKARVGTGSLRRRCQLLAQRPDLVIEPVRGNIDTRLRKLRDGLFDAIVLAMAGLKRVGLYDEAIMSPLEESEMIPAPGQGALALQCRRDHRRALELLGPISDISTFTCVLAERGLVRSLRGDCLSPIGAHARLVNNTIHLVAAVGARGGDLPVLHASATAIEPDSAVLAAYNSLLEQDVTHGLHGATT